MANDINTVTLTGRLTRDSELKATAGGTSVCRFSLAVNRQVKSGDSWVNEVDYFDIVIWGKKAENLSKYLVKGKPVVITGELRQNRWEQDGKKYSRVEVNATEVVLQGSGETAKPSTNAAPQGAVSGSIADEIKQDFNGSDVPF